MTYYTPPDIAAILDAAERWHIVAVNPPFETRGETMLDETELDEDLDEDEYTDATHRMIALGYAVSALFGAAVATVFWAVVWVLTRQ